MPTCMKPYFGIIQLFESYLKSIGSLQILSAEEEKDLFSEYWNGNDAALEELLLKSQYIVIQESLTFKDRGFEIQDILQEANLGCFEALRNYEMERGNLKAYLQFNVFRHLENFTQTYDSLIRLPLNIKAEIQQIKQELEDYFSSVLDEPSYDDFENYFIEKDYRMKFVELFFDQKFQVFFGDIVNRIDLDLDGLASDTFESPDHKLIQESLKEDIQITLSTLIKNQPDIVNQYFGLSDGTGNTLEGIGDLLNLTRERIRQILAQALERLQHSTRSRKLTGYLSIFYYDRPLKIDENYYFNNFYEDDEHVINLLEAYIKPRKRITAYPEIKNLSKECRIQINSILEVMGQPLKVEEIIDLILEKYPLINPNIIHYALKTSDGIIKIDRNHYALKKWNFIEVIKPPSVELFDRKKLEQEIISILKAQEAPISFQYLLSKLVVEFGKNEFTNKDEKKIENIIKNCENIIRTLDSKYYYLEGEEDEDK